MRRQGGRDDEDRLRVWLLVRDGRARRWRVHVTSYVADGYVYGLAVAASHGQRERQHQERCKRWSGEAGLAVSVCQKADCELAWV